MSHTQITGPFWGKLWPKQQPSEDPCSLTRFILEDAGLPFKALPVPHLSWPMRPPEIQALLLFPTLQMKKPSLREVSFVSSANRAKGNQGAGARAWLEGARVQGEGN